jgi:hypothetical protein
VLYGSSANLVHEIFVNEGKVSDHEKTTVNNCVIVTP